MAIIDTPQGPLYFEVCDLVPPWRPRRPAILFHHGIAADVNVWNEWIPILAPHYRLVRFDMRGFGRSSIPAADHAWSFDGLVDDALRVADAAGAARFHLVGESIGGTAALACALSAPGRVASLCLSNAAARGGVVGNVTGWAEEVKRHGQDGWADRMMERRFHPDGIDPSLWSWYRKLHATCSMSATLGLANLLLTSDLGPRLPDVRVPTLLLSPDGSPFIPARVMADMHAAIPGAELQVFAHARHGLPLSHGGPCAATLLAFLVRRAERNEP
jgi:pimeloyl-ACP methyl ester carboxylesterase